MAQYYPERVRAVASLNTPLFPLDPTTDPMLKLKAIPIFDYQIYFQEPGVAEAELEKDLMRTFKIFFLDMKDKDSPQISTTGVCARGGLFVGLPEDIPRSNMLTEADLEYYVSQYKDSGFRRPLNWYRNVERSWRWMCSRPGEVATVCLSVYLSVVCLSVSVDDASPDGDGWEGLCSVARHDNGYGREGMPVREHNVMRMASNAGRNNADGDDIPNLTRGHIEECGHWTQMEKPAEVNRILISWLQETHRKPTVTMAPKL
ncbi:hypothetical protein CRUP_031663 [Coryphaenoides rupestris]|nr:hypothetical protein CRUP_031663 [Coryphaenoides rupestris]